MAPMGPFCKPRVFTRDYDILCYNESRKCCEVTFMPLNDPITPRFWLTRKFSSRTACLSMPILRTRQARKCP